MDKPAVYRIRVSGIVPENWFDYLSGMKVVAASRTETILEGHLPDQAALKGVLDILYDLFLPVEEVKKL